MSLHVAATTSSHLLYIIMILATYSKAKEYMAVSSGERALVSMLPGNHPSQIKNIQSFFPRDVDAEEFSALIYWKPRMNRTCVEKFNSVVAIFKNISKTETFRKTFVAGCKSDSPLRSGCKRNLFGSLNFIISYHIYIYI